MNTNSKKIYEAPAIALIEFGMQEFVAASPLIDDAPDYGDGQDPFASN